MADTRVEGQRFGDVALSRLTWQEIEGLYGAMRSEGMGVDWIRRCATVLTSALELGPQARPARRQPSQGRDPRPDDPFEAVAPSADEVRKVLIAATKRDPRPPTPSRCS
jgi:hypothetical protein